MPAVSQPPVTPVISQPSVWSEAERALLSSHATEYVNSGSDKQSFYRRVWCIYLRAHPVMPNPEEIAESGGDAMKAFRHLGCAQRRARRLAQMTYWYQNNGKRAAAEQASGFVAPNRARLLNLTNKEKRKPQPVHAWMRVFYDKPEVKAAYDQAWEAAVTAGWDEKKEISFRNMWAGQQLENADHAARALVDEYRETGYLKDDVERYIEVSPFDDSDMIRAKQIQESLDNLPHTLKRVAESLHKQTGWNFSITCGGPLPRAPNGKVNTLHLSVGKCKQGMEWSDWNSEYKEDIRRFRQFCDATFSPAECMALSLTRIQTSTFNASSLMAASTSTSTGPTSATANASFDPAVIDPSLLDMTLVTDVSLDFVATAATSIIEYPGDPSSGTVPAPSKKRRRAEKVASNHKKAKARREKTILVQAEEQVFRSESNPFLAPSAVPPVVSSPVLPSAPPQVSSSVPPHVLPTAPLQVLPSVTSLVPPLAAPQVLPSAAPHVPPPAAPHVLPSPTSPVLPFITSPVPPSAPPQVVPEATPHVPPSSAPQVPPSAPPQVVPEATPHVPPSAAPQVPPSAPPQVVPSATPHVVPSATPQVVPSAAPHVPPSAPPHALPTAPLQVPPSVVSPVPPSVAPQVPPSAPPQVVPEAMPHVASSAAPQVVPSAAPQIPPSAMPQVSLSALPLPLAPPAAASQAAVDSRTQTTTIRRHLNVSSAPANGLVDLDADEDEDEDGADDIPLGVTSNDLDDEERQEILALNSGKPTRAMPNPISTRKSGRVRKASQKLASLESTAFTALDARLSAAELIGKVVLDESLPTYFTSAVKFMGSQEYGPYNDFLQMLKAFIVFEAKSQFRAQNSRTKAINRPKVIQTWMTGPKRDFASMKSWDPGQDIAGWFLWWATLQPAWRGAIMPHSRETPPGARYPDIKTGQMGVVTVVASLVCLYLSTEEQELCQKLATGAHDLCWVLKAAASGISARDDEENEKQPPRNIKFDSRTEYL
ncbi:hypothetical protein PUNSTDRAFT_133532 [Punctularia strigosozonata HHB-11173 SS5]|uniref:uncharacterized protein n=1 Tax=Punctularia strigosozonata (strain HHB-11173) TaxID=741275 RepID=UPI0004417831|nr:uncharacterized protein PUNSTDRAFT_133532 [Punctularia strigosozonata HHB-11173 SS5]EIN09764.1 hypothetical protein PUNSTDRAFT_133532 [Punctularia strigosozonata HHB-11173 SS5]